MQLPSASRTEWRTTRVANVPMPRPRRQDPSLIFSPDGSQVLCLVPGNKNKAPADLRQVECQSGPRLRRDPSLMDMTDPRPLNIVDDLVPEDTVHRRNPCCLCNLGFFHGAMNFAITSTGLHFFVMFYCIYIALFTENYTLSFMKFWGINLKYDDGSDATKHLITEVHVTSVVGAVIEILGLVIGVGLIYGIVKESMVFCHLWCLVSSILTAISIFGVIFLATRLSFMVLIPIPIAVMIQLFGLWVIITYVKSLSDPKKCPVCHQRLPRKHAPCEILLPLSSSQFPSEGSFPHIPVSDPAQLDMISGSCTAKTKA